MYCNRMDVYTVLQICDGNCNFIGCYASLEYAVSDINELSRLDIDTVPSVPVPASPPSSICIDLNDGGMNDFQHVNLYGASGWTIAVSYPRYIIVYVICKTPLK